MRTKNQFHKSPDGLHDEVRHDDVGDDPAHLKRGRRAGLREIAADDRGRGHVERVDEEIQRESVIGVIGHALNAVADHDQSDRKKACVIPVRHAHLGGASRLGRSERSSGHSSKCNTATLEEW